MEGDIRNGSPWSHLRVVVAEEQDHGALDSGEG